MTPPLELVTDALGFHLKMVVCIGALSKLGDHRTYEDSETGKVSSDAVHHLNIKDGLEPPVLTMVISHEVYHLFYSVRHLITVDEETEAETFGELVRRIHSFVLP